MAHLYSSIASRKGVMDWCQYGGSCCCTPPLVFCSHTLFAGFFCARKKLGSWAAATGAYCPAINKHIHKLIRFVANRFAWFPALIRMPIVDRGIPTLSSLSRATNLIFRLSERYVISPAPPEYCFVQFFHEGKTGMICKSRNSVDLSEQWSNALPTQVEVEEAKQYAEENR